MTTALPRSGTQTTLSGYGYTATIASIGATLRELSYEGRDLVVPFEANELRPRSRGVTLAPWPNRIEDGRYVFRGQSHQLPLSEPARQNAIHGLVSWADFSVVAVDDDRVTLTTTIAPQVGYPFRVAVDVEYTLTENGLVQSVTGRNLGEDAAPWGVSAHPYLLGGVGKLDEWRLSLPASRVLRVTEDRLLPVAVEELDQHSELDFRAPRPIESTFIDHAFTGLRAEEGVTTVTVTGRDGHGAGMSWDGTCSWVQIHTADSPAEPEMHRLGLAVEPMTCPPDAFNSGTDLVVLEPGQAYSAAWMIFAF